MKYIKTFEDYPQHPQPGDYLSINRDGIRGEYRDFINRTICKLINYNHESNEIYVRYDDVPENLKVEFYKIGTGSSSGYYKSFGIRDIVDFAPTKKELQLKLKAMKYNL
jgi:hypothetical protein